MRFVELYMNLKAKTYNPLDQRKADVKGLIDLARQWKAKESS